jgi:3-hydroxybutyrate dehydrogenase
MMVKRILFQRVSLLRMKEKIMLITGAGHGIGKGIAERAAAAGWTVLVTDQSFASAHEVATSLVSLGQRAEAYPLDVTDANAIERLRDDLRGRTVDVLINNAGLQYVARIEDFPQATWDRLIRVMLNGPCMLTRAVLEPMRQQGFGRIINIGSIHSLVASPYKSAYVAAKHGLLGFSKVIALETAGSDITINTICPSYVRTQLVEQQIASQAKQHGLSEADVIDQIMLKPMPKRTFISIDELYGIITFLISDAARNITGQAIPVDGGWTIQ